jgi:hypothetical protein
MKKPKGINISFSGPCKPLWSCSAVVVHEDHGSYPAVYLTKARGASPEVYNAIVAKIRELMNLSAV